MDKFLLYVFGLVMAFCLGMAMLTGALDAVSQEEDKAEAIQAESQAIVSQMYANADIADRTAARQARQNDLNTLLIVVLFQAAVSVFITFSLLVYQRKAFEAQIRMLFHLGKNKTENNDLSYVIDASLNRRWK